jgi:poly-beta-1,6-N-acetyl-D-glucosamine synthase
MSRCASLRYALITPARNEEAFIEETIRSVVAQSVVPERWIIVDDGSTDRTGEIVRTYGRRHEWIRLLSLPQRTERAFAAKARAFAEGYESMKGLPFEIIGNLDADISFERDYVCRLLEKFERDPKLGIAGSPFREGTVQYDVRFSRKDHVSGACQLFRRECFDAIGGYLPQRVGGIDVVAVVSARMKGWRTETFTDQFCVHHRPMGSANDRLVRRYFKSGHGDYCLGVHPMWQFSRCIYQMTRRPFVAGGALLLAGYVWACVTRASMPVSSEFVRFRRHEQMQWLWAYVGKWLGVEKRPVVDDLAC